METRFQALTKIEESLAAAMQTLNSAKLDARQLELYEGKEGCEGAAEMYNDYLGNAINDIVRSMRKAQEQMNAYLDAEEFFNTDRL